MPRLEQPQFDFIRGTKLSKQRAAIKMTIEIGIILNHLFIIKEVFHLLNMF